MSSPRPHPLGRTAVHRATHAEARTRGCWARAAQGRGLRGTLSRHLSPACGHLGMQVGTPAWGASACLWVFPCLGSALSRLLPGAPWAGTPWGRKNAGLHRSCQS